MECPGKPHPDPNTRMSGKLQTVDSQLCTLSLCQHYPDEEKFPYWRNFEQCRDLGPVEKNVENFKAYVWNFWKARRPLDLKPAHMGT